MGKYNNHFKFKKEEKMLREKGEEGKVGEIRKGKRRGIRKERWEEELPGFLLLGHLH